MELKNLSYPTALGFLSAYGLALTGSPADAADVAQPIIYDDPPDFDPVSGYVQLYGMLGSLEYDGDDASTYGVGGAGRLNWWLSESWAVQLDATGIGTVIDFDNSNFQFSNDGFGTGVHFAYRMPSNYALGGLVGIGSAQGGFSELWANFAAQGQIYLNDLTLYGQAGYLTNFGGNKDGDGYYAFLQARYFWTPNLAVVGDVTWGHVEVEDVFCCPEDSDYDVFKWGIGGEWRPDGTPGSFFARYQGQHAEFGPNFFTADLDQHQFLIGFKLFVNQDTLQANDRQGATFLDANPLFGEFNAKFVD